jgi:hypothetical protein
MPAQESIPTQQYGHNLTIELVDERTGERIPWSAVKIEGEE